MSPIKRDHFKRSLHLPTINFQGNMDMLVFRGVTLAQMRPGQFLEVCIVIGTLDNHQQIYRTSDWFTLTRIIWTSKGDRFWQCLSQGFGMSKHPKTTKRSDHTHTHKHDFLEFFGLHNTRLHWPVVEISVFFLNSKTNPHWDQLIGWSWQVSVPTGEGYCPLPVYPIICYVAWINPDEQLAFTICSLKHDLNKERETIILETHHIPTISWSLDQCSNLLFPWFTLLV